VTRGETCRIVDLATSVVVDERLYRGVVGVNDAIARSPGDRPVAHGNADFVAAFRRGKPQVELGDDVRDGGCRRVLSEKLRAVAVEPADGSHETIDTRVQIHS
jgi:hypothetical protein